MCPSRKAVLASLLAAHRLLWTPSVGTSLPLLCQAMSKKAGARATVGVVLCVPSAFLQRGYEGAGVP